ncbi:hypothetical protein JX266_014050 [Neoarthrinium moseri]|nr:hypothetical protein JX266_014050 [Neoarthrinium moseri]
MYLRIVGIAGDSVSVILHEKRRENAPSNEERIDGRRWLGTHIDYQFRRHRAKASVCLCLAVGSEVAWLLLVCCCAGHAGTSFIALILDVGLSGVSGDVAASPSGAGGNIISDVGLPTFQMTCRLEMVSLIAACIAILFFILSVFLEIHMNRSRHKA